MTIFFLVTLFACLLVAGCVALAYALHRATDGFENETGFHSGKEPSSEGATASAAISSASSKQSDTALIHRAIAGHST
jgi:hypothetical protein